MKHPDWKETKVQRRMVRRIATDLAMEELYMQKKAEAKRKRQFDKLLLEPVAGSAGREERRGRSRWLDSAGWKSSRTAS